MPSRPRQHEIETESKRAFASHIPSQWVLRDLVPDYGIDQQVEIFREGTATGLEFYVQLKGTDASLPRALSVPLPISHVSHYASLALPLLMVRFHAPTRRFFVRWFHSFDPHYADPAESDAKTVTFRWQETDEWQDATPEMLVAGVEAFRRFRASELNLPIRFYLQADEIVGGAAEVALQLQPLASRVPRIVAIDRAVPAAGAAVLAINDASISASLGDVKSVTVHFEEGHRRTAFREPDAADVMVVIALVLLHIGFPGEAAQVFASTSSTSTTIIQPEIAFMAASAFARSNRPLEALCLAALIGAQGHEGSDVAEMVLAAATLGVDVTEDVREEFRSVMRRRANRRIAQNRPTWAGADFYNIGAPACVNGHHGRLSTALSSFARHRNPTARDDAALRRL